MLNFRQYKVLKQLKLYQDEKSKNSNYQHQIGILDDTFYRKIKYKRSTLNTILKQLDKAGYIVDIFNKIPTNVHTIEITDEGLDALSNYYINILLGLLKIIITALITLFIEHLFDIIDLLKNYLS